MCIDQKNNQEKNVHLPLMTDIYRRASRTIIWLGPPENCQETRLLRTLLRGLSRTKNLPISADDLLPTLISDDSVALKALGRLFCHPWFERMWILQEVTVPEKVHFMYSTKACALNGTHFPPPLRKLEKNPTIMHDYTTIYLPRPQIRKSATQT